MRNPYTKLSLVIFCLFSSFAFAAEGPATDPNKPASPLVILEIKKSVLNELKGQDPELVKRVMLAIDKSVKEQTAKENMIEKKIYDTAAELKESSKRIGNLIKEQSKLIKSYADLEKHDELMNELKMLYSDKMDEAIEKVHDTTEKLRESFAEKTDKAVETADALLEELYEKSDITADQLSDVINEMNQMTYLLQDNFQEKLDELTDQMRETIDTCIETYEKGVDKMLENKEIELDEKKLDGDDESEDSQEEEVQE